MALPLFLEEIGLRILMIGDVVGRPGRRAVKSLLPGLCQELGLDLIIANAENAAGGMGLTEDTAQELLEAGVDVLTSGNHIWDQKDFIPHLSSELPVLRPSNYPPGVPGQGYLHCKGALVVNLVGRTFMSSYDDPFRAMDALLAEKTTGVVIVDFHAEATSEKGALGWYLDGRVSAVLGTHTHVPTADPRILPQGTAYVTDVGMCGARDSVIGDDVGAVLQRFLTQLPYRITVAKGRNLVFNSVLVDIDEATGRARSIQRVDRGLQSDGG